MMFDISPTYEGAISSSRLEGTEGDPYFFVGGGKCSKLSAEGGAAPLTVACQGRDDHRDKLEHKFSDCITVIETNIRAGVGTHVSRY